MATILCIEDNEQNQYLIRYLLEKRGHAVVLAGDGSEGIRLATELLPELILLDIQLPGMDGYQVAGILKGIPQLAAIPIVAVTSYAMVGDRERAIASGCSAYIEKPIDPAAFPGQVEEHLPGQSRKAD
ncbi:CheY-like chemotaxis protein [Sulfuritortus calidifontis]|uniref:CheY-like chemotaxis protein n=1 Tax=Sulfuritortus calidifontis TaxID=1914471 RepID=A0A4R3JX94_9PROT|nr:response regulator [Sulfuritortus calidifontis]TCS73053.1 CheY-like chemotaxis protein [Sulfuritortus calidifontis]